MDPKKTMELRVAAVLGRKKNLLSRLNLLPIEDQLTILSDMHETMKKRVRVFEIVQERLRAKERKREQARKSQLLGRRQ